MFFFLLLLLWLSTPKIGKHHDSCKARTQTLAGRQAVRQTVWQKNSTLNEGEEKITTGERLIFATPKNYATKWLPSRKTQRHEIRFGRDKTIARIAYIKYDIFFCPFFSLLLCFVCLNIIFRNDATVDDEATSRTQRKIKTLTVNAKITSQRRHEEKRNTGDKIRIRIDLFSFRLCLTLHFGAACAGMCVCWCVCAHVCLCHNAMLIFSCWFVYCVHQLCLLKYTPKIRCNLFRQKLASRKM